MVRDHRPGREAAPGRGPVQLVVIGRYVLRPGRLRVLRETPPGRGGEIQLTDALRVLADRSLADDGGGVHGVLFRGRRYDTGNKLDYLRTLVQFACERPDLAGEFVPWLRSYLGSPVTGVMHSAPTDRRPAEASMSYLAEICAAITAARRRASSAWPTRTAPRARRGHHRGVRAAAVRQLGDGRVRRRRPRTWPGRVRTAGHAAGAGEVAAGDTREHGGSRAAACGS